MLASGVLVTLLACGAFGMRRLTLTIVLASCALTLIGFAFALLACEKLMEIL
jgi:hypothetical protein